MCDLKAQEDEGPEEGEIQDDDEDEETSLYLSSSSSSYDRDIRNHERQRAARKYLPHDSSGSISMSVVNDRMLSRTNHERKEKSRVRPKHPESTHHKPSTQPRSGLTHGKENRHVHQSRDKRSPPVHHSQRPRSKTPMHSPHSRDHSTTTSKCHRGAPETPSSRSGEGAEREGAKREAAARHTRKRRTRRAGAHKRQAIAKAKRIQAKKAKASHVENGKEVAYTSNDILNAVDVSEENSLKRKLLTMGALPNKPQSANSAFSISSKEGATEELPKNPTEIEPVHSPLRELDTPKDSSELVSVNGNDPEDIDSGVIFVAAVPKPMPELVTLSDSDAEQDVSMEVENLDTSKGATDMEMSRSPVSSNVDMDLETTIVDISAFNPPSSAVRQSEQDDDDIISLRRAALLSKNRPTKDPAENAEQDEDDLQLRVAALRSAVLRKAAVRKKRRMQTDGGHVLGDETTPVDMDLADTDDEEEPLVLQPQPSPEPPPHPLPPPPLPSESLLQTINVTASSDLFSESVTSALPPPCHFMRSGFLEPGLPTQVPDNLPHQDQPRFQIDAPPANVPFPVLHPPHDIEGVPLVIPHQVPTYPGHPNDFSAQVPPIEYPVHNEFCTHRPTMDYPVRPVPPPPVSVPLEYPGLPLEYPPPAVPPAMADYPVGTDEYQRSKPIDFDPSMPTPYPDPLQFPEIAEPHPPNFTPEQWNPGGEQVPGSQEPLSAILTKAMEKKVRNTRPNLREIQINKAPAKKDKLESEPMELELSSMVVLDEVAESPVSSPANALEDSDRTEAPTEAVAQRQPSVDEDETLLREKLLQAISSKRETIKPQDNSTKTSDQSMTKSPDIVNKPAVSKPQTRSKPTDKTRKTIEKSQVQNGTKGSIKPNVMSKDRLLYSKSDTLKVTVPVQPRNAYPTRKPDGPKQKAKTAPPFQFIIQLGEDSDSSDGLEDMGDVEDDTCSAPRKEPSMYHLKDYCPRTGVGELEKDVGRVSEDSASMQSGAAPLRSESDLSKEVDKFLKDVRSSHEGSGNTARPESPPVSQIAILKSVHATPLAIRHLPASTQEEYRKLKQIIAEKELQKKAQKKQSTGVQSQSKVSDSKHETSNPTAPAFKQPTKVQALSPKASTARPSQPATSPKPSTTPPVSSTPLPKTIPSPKTTLLPSKATALRSLPPKVTAPVLPKTPTGCDTNVVSTTPNLQDRPVAHFVTKKALFNGSYPIAPPVPETNCDFFRGAPIMYGQCAPDSVLPSLPPKVSTPGSEQPVVVVKRPVSAPVPASVPAPVPASVPAPVPASVPAPVPAPKAASNPVTSALVPQVPVKSVPVSTSAPVKQQVREKQLEEAEMNLLKERSAVVGQIMGLTRLQTETEELMTAQDVSASTLSRILEELHAACKDWQKRSNEVKWMMQNVREKREQLRGAYSRTEALARSCKNLGAQVKGAAYTLPVGSMMQSKQKVANQQYGRMIRWHKGAQRKMRGIIGSTDTLSAFLKSRCQEPLTVAVNPSALAVDTTSVSFDPPAISVKPLVGGLPPGNPSGVTSDPLAVPVPTVSPLPPPIPVTAPPTPPKVESLPGPLPVPVKPEMPQVATPRDEELSENKNTPSMFCARRIVRIAKKRLREGGKPRELVKEPTRMVLGADDDPLPVKKQAVLTNYQSPLDHLGNSGFHDVFFDPEAILCPYELNGKCEDDECAFQHQVKSRQTES